MSVRPEHDRSPQGADTPGVDLQNDEPARESESTREAELSERDQRILEFERHWAKHAGAKDEAIRAEFSLPAARYYQLLNAVIDLPGAVRTDPMLVRRLQRARRERLQLRTARSFSTTGTGTEPVRSPTSESNT